ncbi:MAG: hypothetical protein KAR20_29895, partial [Candidatus Heimdallarchaeota archaeon]|nr:hypothetical protein [Candidatus Heimdallarchaeota archaeon]
PKNGIYDAHNPGLGDINSEIWLGRITMNSQWENETELIKNYFRKNHDYREGNLSVSHKALMYLDDDISDYSEYYLNQLLPLYQKRNVVFNKTETNSTDYKERLTSDYEWIEIWCHANLSSIRHSFMINDGIDNNGNNIIDEKGDGGEVYSSDIREIDPTAIFYNIQTCSAANYSTEDYLCGWYVFSHSNGLCALGSTRVQGTFDFYEFYMDLGYGKSIGRSFKHWFNEVIDDYTILHSFDPEYADTLKALFSGMTIIGDPTLKPLARDNDPNNDDDGDGVSDDVDILPLDPLVAYDYQNINSDNDDGNTTNEEDSDLDSNTTDYVKKYWWAYLTLLMILIVITIVYHSRQNKNPPVE